MSLRLLIIFLCAWGSALPASKEYLLLGGGGEPRGKTTIFDEEIKKAGEFVKTSKDWKSEVAFNGGHEKTEEIIQGAFAPKGASNIPFTEQAFRQLIERYKRKLQNGSLKEGDQLLVQISSHGAMAKGQELSHGVAVKGPPPKNLERLGGSKQVSLDALKELADLAKQKKVKLAVLDFSCHSGSSLSLANEDVCVISNTGPNHFSWAGRDNTFQARFAQNMSEGKSLEDVFLEAMAAKEEPSFPMMSPPLAREIQDQAYSMLAPYLYDARNEAVEGKLKGFLEAQTGENSCRQTRNNYQDLISLSYQMESVAEKALGEFAGFRRALHKYFDYQSALAAGLANKAFEDLEALEKFCSDYEYPRENPRKNGPQTRLARNCDSYTTEEVLIFDVTAYEKLIRRQLSQASTPRNKARLASKLRNLEKLKRRKDELLKTRPDLIKYSNFYQKLPRFRSKTKQFAREVAGEFSKMFVEVYRKQKQERRDSNACAEFVL